MEERDVYKEGQSEVTASALVESNMTAYAEATLASKFPSVYDGLKQILRRILWAMRPHKNKMKVQQATGETMKIHPSGDQSIADAITRLAQPWNNVVPLVDACEGNVGTYHGDAPAAPRYLEVMLSDFARDVFFNNTNMKSLYLIKSVQGGGHWEPEVLSPCIPTTLICGAMGIALGFRMQSTVLNLQDVCDLSQEYILCRQKKMPRAELEHHLLRYLLPDFPVAGLLRNHKELLKAYQEGDYERPILMDGYMELSPGMITLKTIPYGNAFKNAYDLLGQEVLLKDGFIAENILEVLDSSKDNTKSAVDLILRRGVDVFSVLDKLKRKVRFTQSWTPMLKFSDRQGRKLDCTPFTLLDLWYEERYRSVKADLMYSSYDTVLEQRKIEALLTTIDHAKELFEIFTSSGNVHDAIPRIVHRFHLTSFQAQYLAKFTYGELTKTSREDLLERQKAVKIRIDEIRAKMDNIDGVIIESIQMIRKTYANKIPRRTRLPEFKGCIVVEGHGVIQFWDLNEMNHLVTRFGAENVSIYIYPNGSYHKYMIVNGLFKSEESSAFGKEFACQYFFTTKYKLNYTVVVREGTLFRLNDLCYRVDDDAQYFMVGDRCTTVAKDGIVRCVETSSITCRRDAKANGSKSNVIYVSPTFDTQGDVIVVHANPDEPNVVRIDCVKNGQRISTPPSKAPVVLGIYRVRDEVSITVPSSVLSRCSIRHLYIPDVSKTLGSLTSVRLYLTRKTTSHDRSLVQIDKNSVIWTVKE